MTLKARSTISVAIIAPSTHAVLGGQEIQAELLMSGWRNDAEVRAVFTSSNPPLVGRAAALERLPGLRTLARLQTRLVALARALDTSDVVHVFSGAGSSFLIGALPAIAAARRNTRPVLLHYHSGRGVEHLRTSALLRAVVRRVACVVVPSPFLASAFVDAGATVRVIPNVVDEPRCPFAWPRPGDPLVVCTRNLEPIYGIPDVLRAFAAARADHPRARLVLAGDGSQREALRRQVQAMRLQGVELAGRLSRDAVGALLARATVWINASRVDNMPVSLLEAFAAGVPVVSYATGGITWIAQHERTALLAQPGDVDGLAHHLRHALREPNSLADMVQMARQEAARYAWSAVRPAWLEAYRFAAEARAPGRRVQRGD